MMTDREYYFWTSISPGWTCRRLKDMHEKYPDPKSILGAFRSDPAFFSCILTETNYRASAELLDEAAIRKKIAEYEERNIRFVTPADSAFPRGIRAMNYDRPPVVYYAGDLALCDRPALSVVGTRKFSRYGDVMTRKFVTDMAGSGVSIVSGLASGIDTFAHRAALDCGLKTIAVLGTGIAHVTPEYRADLAREIVREGGLIVSEFDPAFGGATYSFPQRNRLIAALGDGVLVVEAGEHSGTLYTVDHAVEQGKEVFLIPANLDAKNFVGIMEAYSAGKGNFVYTPDDLWRAYGLTRDPQISRTLPQAETLNLGDDRQRVLDILGRGALNYDRLIEESDMNQSQFSVLLTDLEMLGLIESRGGLYYKK